MRVLLVGWDAADWKVIDPLLESGEMPHLASVIGAGMRGNIATIYPALSPMLWTSIATGKRPTKHGIHGFTEPTPDGLQVRPVSNLGRKTKAIWNILNQNGKRSLVVGWWPSHPAEPIRGAMVSNHFPLQTSQAPGAPLPAGTVWPERLAGTLSELRVHGTEITGEILRMFAPDYDQVDQEEDKTVHDLAGLIAETMSIHGAATELLEHEPWDFAAVYYVGIDHFSHRFMRYHAGKQPGRDKAAPEIFQETVRNAYRFHDAMLGRLLELAGSDCAVMVVSDHGFHSDRLLPDYVPAEPAGPAVEHRHFGIVCLRAPGVPAGERIYGATVLDVAPTLLHLFGLPPAQDMDGKVLINAFRGQPLAKPIPSWDDVPGEDGRHSGDRQYDRVAAAEVLRQLVALGYVAPPTEDAARYVKECIVENRYNLARAWMDAGRPDEAAALLRELIAGDSESGRFYTHLFRCLLDLEDEAGAAELLARFDEVCSETALRAAAELQRRQEERPNEQLSIRAGEPDAREHHERRRLREQAEGYAGQRKLMRCSLQLAAAKRTNDQEPAREALAALSSHPGLGAGMATFLADGFARVGMEDRALEIIRQARLEDRDHWEMISLEARLHYEAGRYNDAAGCAIESLALVYFQPALHFLLGKSLVHLGEEERGVAEMEVALAQAPGMVAAEEELARVERQRGEIGQAGLRMARAARLRRRARSGSKKVHSARPAPLSGAAVFERLTPPPEDRLRVITVVTGLPRSGTSMMMQMLDAAGMAPYTDGARIADEDNPRGYFEHEQAMRLREEGSWIPQARGKAVKIVAQLLPHLPAGEHYRVVFLHREMEEILASQRAMLTRLGRTGATLADADLMQAYRRDLARVQEWLAGRSGIPVLAVNYDDAIQTPAGVAQRLSDFLGAPFDRSAAASAVVRGLRRTTSARG